ncbi:4,5-dioxygenase [Vibrio sp. qd031]|uniref:DOPA 4,5-dioxygenase family protein n=1 Tax=Vibrio sp. qd031 TaxID=1603038 RepID=UPI000A0F85DD|nr:DOPA 4,5-dioxygenase family protein [Vibrio sp. qd031]ORT48547.1 4,5-dioxygenase [Vibrio sp. qd031]
MSSPNRPINIHQHYHAHVYFDEQTLPLAQQLCCAAGNKFGLPVGRVHKKPVGPHTLWSCQILFNHSHFEQLIPWLEQHRQSLSVLIHADTGDDYSDHTRYAYWLGDEVALDLSGFSV